MDDRRNMSFACAERSRLGKAFLHDAAGTRRATSRGLGARALGKLTSSGGLVSDEALLVDPCRQKEATMTGGSTQPEPNLEDEADEDDFVYGLGVTCIS